MDYNKPYIPPIYDSNYYIPSGGSPPSPPPPPPPFSPTQVFNSNTPGSGTFTAATNATYKIEVAGAGGGGGHTNPEGGSGGGGGGGGYARSEIVMAQDETLDYVIGTGGAAGVTANDVAANGGSSQTIWGIGTALEGTIVASANGGGGGSGGDIGGTPGTGGPVDIGDVTSDGSDGDGSDGGSGFLGADGGSANTAGGNGHIIITQMTE